MHLEATLSQLRNMHLTTMAQSFENHLSRGDLRGVSSEDFFALLVEEEYRARDAKKLARLIASANFKPEGACLENITVNATRNIQKKDLFQFTTATWIKQAHNIVITGPTGCGKTYLAEAIGLSACKQGFGTKKIRFKKLFDEINAARGTGLYLKYLEKLQKTRVLIIDDFLMSDITTEDASHIFEIIEERTQIGPLILTTQYPIAQWHKRMPDPTIADAICDRLVHTAIIFDLKGGDSMRKTNCQSHSK